MEQENFDILTLLKQNQSQMNLNAKADCNEENKEKSSKRKSTTNKSGEEEEPAAPKKITKIEKRKIEKMER